MIQKTVGLMSLLLMGLVPNSYGLEVQELSLPMTRNEADAKLSKDYDYSILEDASLRRSWKLNDKTVHMDFDLARKGQAICIIIEYKKPVSLKAARQDMVAVVGKQASSMKLRKVSKSLAEMGYKGTIGNKVGQMWVLAQPSAGDKKKCGRVLIFAKKPTKNRLALDEASEGGGYTAMGSKGPGINISAIAANEEARRNAKPSAAIAAATPEVEQASALPEQAEIDSADDFGAEYDTFAASTDNAAAGSNATNKQAGFLPAAVSAPVQGWLAGLGLSALVVDILIVTVPVVLLLIIWRIIASVLRKKRNRAAYARILGNNKEENAGTSAGTGTK